MKRNLLITLVVIAFLSLAFFGFKTFITSIYNQRDCEFANIDNIEVNVGIDIPSIESTICNYDEIKNQKSVYFKFDKKVNIQDYCKSNTFKILQPSDLDKFKDLDFVGNNHPFKDESQNYYFKSENRRSNSFHAILNVVTKELWIVISYKD
jgi:hypothetical protein